MELNTIKQSGSWGNASDTLNLNFRKISTDMEQVKNATTRNKGYFNTPEELTDMYPKGYTNDVAYVGLNYPYRIYKWNGSAWKDTGYTGGENIDMNSYTLADSITDSTEYEDVFY